MITEPSQQRLLTGIRDHGARARARVRARARGGRGAERSAGSYLTAAPPSEWTMVPVMPRARSEARNT
jgi:hypothetical protein